MVGESRTNFNTTFNKEKIKEIKIEAVKLNLKTNELLEIGFELFNSLDKKEKNRLIYEYRKSKYEK